MLSLIRLLQYATALRELAKRAFRTAHSYLFQMSTLLQPETLPVIVIESLYFTSAIVHFHFHVFSVLYG